MDGRKGDAVRSDLPRSIGLISWRSRDVLELAIDRREAHVGDLVENAKLLSITISPMRLVGTSVSPSRNASGLDGGGNGAQRLRPDGPLVTRLLQTGENLPLVERHLGAVLLDHRDRRVANSRRS